MFKTFCNKFVKIQKNSLNPARKFFRFLNLAKRTILLKFQLNSKDIKQALKNSYGICPFSNSMGEVICFFVNLNTYLKKHNITSQDTITIFGNKRYLTEIASLFDINAKIQFFSITDSFRRRITKTLKRTSRKGKIDPIPVYADPFFSRILPSNIPTDRANPLSMIDYTKLFMGINKEEDITRPIVRDSRLNEARQFIVNLGFNPDRLIMICPESISLLPVLDIEDFVTLADLLNNMGYDVIFNTKTIPTDKYKAIFESISLTVHIMHLCQAIIGSRSGFLDIIACYKHHPKIIALYPHSDIQNWHLRNGYIDIAKNLLGYNHNLLPIQNYLTSYSLNIYNTAECIEILKYQNDSTDHILNQILQHFK